MTVILHVCQPSNGGVPHVVAQHLEAAGARGWSAHLACPGGDAAVLGRAAGATVHEWPAVRSPHPRHLAAETRAFRAVVAEVSPDVVVLHSAKAGLVGRFVLRGQLPTVFMPHAWSWLAVSGGQEHLARQWERWAARWTHLLGCVGRAEIDAGRAAGVRGDYLVCDNSVSADQLRALAPRNRVTARRQLGVKATSRLVVCVARLAPQKDHETLLRAWDRVTERAPDAELVLVGDGPLAAELAVRAEQRSRVRLTGALPRAAAMTWLVAADVVACSSRFEGRALVPQEAAALGRVVVTTEVAGVREGYSGPGRVVVRVGDDVELGAQIADLLLDQGRLASAEADVAAYGDADRDAPSGAEALLDRCATLIAGRTPVGSPA